MFKESWLGRYLYIQFTNITTALNLITLDKRFICLIFLQCSYTFLFEIIAFSTTKVSVHHYSNVELFSLLIIVLLRTYTFAFAHFVLK